MEFKGFNDWIEIFRGGTQIDSQGKSWDGDKIIESATKQYQPGVHDAPLVVGHPADNAPAFGWVDGLRTTVKNGVKTLEAHFKQVAPEFESLVKSGRFKKRSAAFYPDGSLRHVGWLGAVPPAVKGLADVAFQADAESIEFTEEFSNQGGFVMELKEFFENLKSWAGLTAAVQGQGQPSPFPGQPATPVTPQPAAVKSFTEADLEAAKKEVVEEAKKQAAAEFAEKEAASKKAAREAEIKAHVKNLVDSGKVMPAFSEHLTRVLLAADTGPEMEFGEQKTKGSPADCLIDTLEHRPEWQLFGELPAPDSAAFAEMEADTKAAERIAARAGSVKKE